MRRYQYDKLSLLFTLLLTACVQNTVSTLPGMDLPEVTSTKNMVSSTIEHPTATRTPHLTPEPPPSPTSAIMVDPQVTVFPPTLADTMFSDDIVFGTGPVGNCTLPCWYGLVVGQSDKEDMQQFYRNVLQFKETEHFFAENTLPVLSRRLPEGLSGTGYTWHLAPDPLQSDGFGSFAARTFYDSQSFTLAAVNLDIGYAPFAENITPQRIMRELGTPDQMYGYFGGTERGDNVRSSLYIVYSQGYVFYYPEVYIPIIPTGDTIEYCIDDTHWIDNYGVSTVFVGLFEPFTKPTPLMRAIFPGMETEPSMPFAEFFDTTLSEMTQRALANEQVCFSHTSE